jgi:glycine/D-amino acid oxidase-like deaminating enzyme
MIYDLIIIGGGMSGISVAHHFREKNILILERGTLLSGATGRNAGFIISGFGEHYAKTVSRLGRDTAREIQLIHLSSHKKIAALARNINCYYSPTGSLTIPFNDTELEDLQRSYKLLKDDGFNVEWRETVDVGLHKNCAALLNKDDAWIDSLSFWKTIASNIPAKTECEVLQITDGTNSIHVRTNDGSYETENIIFCLNAFSAQLLPELEGLYIPLRGQMVELRINQGTPTLSPVIMNYGDIYWNFWAQTLRLGGFEYSSPAEEVGISNEISSNILNSQVEWIQKSFRNELFSSIQPIRSWCSTMAFTIDGFPFVGKLQRNRSYVMAGMCGLGHSYVMECAKWLHELITTGHNIIPVYCDSSRIKTLKRFTGGNWRNLYEAWNHGIH